MGKTINNIRRKIIAKKREEALEKLRLNESYLSVAKSELDLGIEQKVSRYQLKIKKQLLPLEKNAASEKDKIKSLYEEKLKKFTEKQRLPRLAVEQSFKRMAKKSGAADAQAWREMKIEQFDNQLEEFTKSWLDKIEKADASKNEQAELAYKEREKELSQKLEDYKSTLVKAADNKFEKLTQMAKTAAAALANSIKEYNEKLLPLSTENIGEMNSADNVLEVNDLVMQFDGLRAVDGLSFEVREGEIFGLIGPNGAGKTTVFNCITQFNKPTSGQIHYKSRNGEIVDVTKKKVHDIIKLGLVRTFQNLELIWELTVLENMLIGAHCLYGANFMDHILHTRRIVREEKIMKAKALDVLKRLGLLDYKDVIPYGLPYGILKRIELARTLMVNPRLIILDEPAAGLNEAETEELAQTIGKIRDDYNCTIFLVEHDMGLVMDICDTVCAISFGKKLAIGTPSETQGNSIVQEAYLGGSMTEDDDE